MCMKKPKTCFADMTDSTGTKEWDLYIESDAVMHDVDDELKIPYQ